MRSSGCCTRWLWLPAVLWCKDNHISRGEGDWLCCTRPSPPWRCDTAPTPIGPDRRLSGILRPTTRPLNLGRRCFCFPRDFMTNAIWLSSSSCRAYIFGHRDVLISKAAKKAAREKQGAIERVRRTTILCDSCWSQQHSWISFQMALWSVLHTLVWLAVARPSRLLYLEHQTSGRDPCCFLSLYFFGRARLYFGQRWKTGRERSNFSMGKIEKGDGLFSSPFLSARASSSSSAVPFNNPTYFYRTPARAILSDR